MKKYLLLRDHRVSGPYSYEELSLTRLRSNDLIWIENESSSWEYAGKINEIISLIRDDLTVATNERPQDIKTDDAHADHHLAAARKDSPVHGNETQFARKTASPEQKKQPHLPTVIAVCFGVILAAPFIKFVAEVPVRKSDVLPAIDHQERTLPSADFQKAIVTEIVPVYTQPTEKRSGNPEKRAHKKTHRTKCRLAAFDGINGLQLTVFNTSADWVDKALVTLDYLRPNGDVVKSENLVFTSIKPHQAQTIDIPSAPRGVQLRYLLLKELAHRYKPIEKHI